MMHSSSDSGSGSEGEDPDEPWPLAPEDDGPHGHGILEGAVAIEEVLMDMHPSQRFHLARGIVESQGGDPNTVTLDRHRIGNILTTHILLVYKRYRVVTKAGRTFMINNAKPSTNVCSWSTPLLHELTGMFTKVRLKQNTIAVF